MDTRKLNRTLLKEKRTIETLIVPEEHLLYLPNKVLQFGTGVLLRGLPDYLIDKANRNGVFNGRIVAVKSTDHGGVDQFFDQDGLYSLHIRGIKNGEEVQESVLISSINKVISAINEWSEVLEIATSDDLQIVISNTTELGIVFLEDEKLTAFPPVSFPGKLTAILRKRFMHFNGDPTKGLVILPTELIEDNADKLKEIVLKLAIRNELGDDFVEWINEANSFCNTLVDCIVPGKLPILEQQKIDLSFGYTDNLAIMAEPFRLWAIESDDQRIIDVISFAQIDQGVIIAPDISKFKELKLRLLNGSHTFSCGLAVLAGFVTVKESLLDTGFRRFLENLMHKEIIPAIIGSNISEEEALDFSKSVIDRFSNPFLDHQWLNISLNYSSKMQVRNVTLLQRFYDMRNESPKYMALGFAAYILFMKCIKDENNGYKGESNRVSYWLHDEHAPFFADVWLIEDKKILVKKVLENQYIWNADLFRIKGFAKSIENYLRLLLEGKITNILSELDLSKNSDKI